MLDTQLGELSNDHKQRLLVALARSNHQHDQSIASTASESNGNEHDQAIAIQHVHLSKLEDHGTISRDQEAQKVTNDLYFDDIESLLIALGENTGRVDGINERHI